MQNGSIKPEKISVKGPIVFKLQYSDELLVALGSWKEAEILGKYPFIF